MDDTYLRRLLFFLCFLFILKLCPEDYNMDILRIRLKKLVSLIIINYKFNCDKNELIIVGILKKILLFCVLSESKYTFLCERYCAKLQRTNTIVLMFFGLKSTSLIKPF